MYKKFLDLGLQPLANKYLTKSDLIRFEERVAAEFNDGKNPSSGPPLLGK